MGFHIITLIKDHELHPGSIKKKGTKLKVDTIKYRELLAGGFIKGTVSERVKKLFTKHGPEERPEAMHTR